MMNFIKKKLKEEKGLTLIELLAVIVILGIIAAIAIPAIGNIITNSTVNALKSDGQNVIAAANLYFTENTGDDQVTIQELVDNGFLDDAGGFAPADGSDIPATYLVDRVDGGNELTGTAADGDVSVAFAAATNAEIDAAGTEESPTTPYPGVTITR